MRNESGDINADETAAVDPKIGDAEPADQPMGEEAARTAANSSDEEKSRNRPAFSMQTPRKNWTAMIRRIRAQTSQAEPVCPQNRSTTSLR